MNGPEHCAELVRKHAKDRFLASLFAPDDKRQALLALYAFDIEIARIRYLVSEPQMGLIRQQWWRDTLRSKGSGHPVAEELASAIESASLPLQPFIALIDAREFDLYGDPMPDMTSLEGYLGETSSAVIQLGSLILAGQSAAAAAEAAGLAGAAYGLALLLADLPQHANYLPSEMTVAAAVAHARQRLATARNLVSTIPKAAMPAFLPVSLTELYLDRISRLGERAGPQSVAISPLRRQWQLWMAARCEGF